jgi:hypothetical protein
VSRGQHNGSLNEEKVGGDKIYIFVAESFRMLHPKGLATCTLVLKRNLAFSFRGLCFDAVSIKGGMITE